MYLCISMLLVRYFIKKSSHWRLVTFVKQYYLLGHLSSHRIDYVMKVATTTETLCVRLAGSILITVKFRIRIVIFISARLIQSFTRTIIVCMHMSSRCQRQSGIASNFSRHSLIYNGCAVERYTSEFSESLDDLAVVILLGDNAR